MIAGGIAITKLKAIEAALSLIPTVFTCPPKKFTTSNNGMPRKPGSDVVLLLVIIIFAGGNAAILFPILLNRGIILDWLFWQSPSVLSVPADKAGHILNDQ